MKLHAVALLATALFFGGCAESVDEIPASESSSDSGSSDGSSGKDSAPVDTGTYDPDTGTEEDTFVDDTGTADDSGEFPDFGGGEDTGTTDETGTTDGGVSFGFGYCSSSSDCPGGCCSEGTCGVALFGACVTF